MAPGLIVHLYNLFCLYILYIISFFLRDAKIINHKFQIANCQCRLAALLVSFNVFSQHYQCCLPAISVLSVCLLPTLSMCSSRTVNAIVLHLPVAPIIRAGVTNENVFLGASGALPLLLW